MSVLALATPSDHGPFQRGCLDEHHHPYAASSFEHGVARPRTDAEKIALPSIRQAIPELRIPVTQEMGQRSVSATTSPVVALPGEYVHSPRSHKRRHLSIDDEREERHSRVPRLYTSTSPRSASLKVLGGGSPILAPRSATEASWPASSRPSPFPPSPYPPTSAGLPSMRSPLGGGAKPNEHGLCHHRPQTPLPGRSLPLPGFMREAARPARGHSADDYVQPLGGFPTLAGQEDARQRSRHGAGYPLGYNHPARSHSLSVGSIGNFEHPPYGATGVGQYPEYIRMGEFANMGLSGDNKQRKRRGNLPKETTDKLRAWFMNHLNHPYPTEEEKQQLMQQTNLQMNQISNWFINARRRQLPTMINNARVETDATAVRGAEGKMLTPGERADYDDGKGDSPISDGDHNCFDAQLDDMKRRRAGHMKRGSV